MLGASHIPQNHRVRLHFLLPDNHRVTSTHGVSLSQLSLQALAAGSLSYANTSSSETGYQFYGRILGFITYVGNENLRSR